MSAFSLLFRRAARTLNVSRNKLSPARVVAPPAMFSLAHGRQATDTFTRNVMLPARMIAPPPAFFSTNAGGGDDDDDDSSSRRRPCSGREGEKKHPLIVSLSDDAVIYQDEHAVTFEFNVPGLGLGDIKATVENDHLRVVNQKKVMEGNNMAKAGMLFMRVCPCWFKARSMTGKIEAGVLTIVVPKVEGVEEIVKMDLIWSSG